MFKKRKLIPIVLAVMLTACLLASPTFADGTWTTASGQIKDVVNKVVFPAIDLILAVFFFAKLGMAYFDYRKSGQFEWTAPAILFACLVFTLTAPTYVWSIIGI